MSACGYKRRFGPCRRSDRSTSDSRRRWARSARTGYDPKRTISTVKFVAVAFPKGAKIGNLSFVILSLLTTYGWFEPHEEE